MHQSHAVGSWMTEWQQKTGWSNSKYNVLETILHAYINMHVLGRVFVAFTKS
jgi:hypothetical protein